VNQQFVGAISLLSG